MDTKELVENILGSGSDHVPTCSRYTTNLDGSISVDNWVNLSKMGLSKIPINFKNINGYFNCSNNKLTSLDGCPEISLGFSCANNRLTSLNGGPKKVMGGFYCYDNELVSLKGVPRADRFFFRNNRIMNFDGLPEFFETHIDLSDNPIDEVYTLFYNDPRSIYWIREFDVIQGTRIVRDRLEEAIHSHSSSIGQLHFVDKIMTRLKYFSFTNYDIV